MAVTILNFINIFWFRSHHWIVC